MSAHLTETTTKKSSASSYPCDLSTRLGRLKLTSPLIGGACPRTLDAEFRRQAVQAGVAALTMPSIFEEQVIRWHRASGRPITSREEALLERTQRHYWPTPACRDAEAYLDALRRASTDSPIPIIANMNGYTTCGWLDFAGELECAGAAAIELNVHRGDAREFDDVVKLERSILDAVMEMQQAVAIPILLKIDDGLFSVPHLARKLVSGVDAIVLFGRFPQVDICLETCRLNASWQLSDASQASRLTLPLLQTHSMSPSLGLVASGGIDHPKRFIKALLAGADAVSVTSAFYRRGPSVARTMLDELRRFMNDKHIADLSGLRDLQPAGFAADEERLMYISALSARLEAWTESSVEALPSGDRYGHVRSDQDPIATSAGG